MAKRAYRTMLLCALIALPGTAGHSEERAASIAVDTGFEGSFEGYQALPAAPRPGAGSVDLTTIQPPIEAQDPAEHGTAIAGGIASFYGRKFDGRRTASGETFDMSAMTAAHRTLPFGTRVRVTNPRNGHSVVVRINDRGPFHANRVLDVSRAAATELGLIGPGSGRVELEVLDS